MTTSRRQPGDPQDPHAGPPTLSAGPAPEEAAATLVLLHAYRKQSQKAPRGELALARKRAKEVLDG